MLVQLVLLLAAATGLSEGDFADALKGEVPVRSESFVTPSGKSAGRGVGAIVIEKPVGDVWATLSRYEDKAEYQPRVEQVTVLDKQPGRLRAKFVIDATVTTARYTAWFELDEKTHTIHWTLDPTAGDNTVREIDGDYRMFELEPARTLVVYRTYVDSGRSISQAIQGYFTRKAIPNLLKAVKKRIESGGTWKK